MGAAPRRICRRPQMRHQRARRVENIDVGAVQPPESGLLEWLHPRALREGWCAVTHPSRGVGLGLEFDPEVFRTVWIWGVYGGWRGHYVLLTEPSTGPPGGLARNVANGTAARLGAHEVLEIGGMNLR